MVLLQNHKKNTKWRMDDGQRFGYESSIPFIQPMKTTRADHPLLLTALAALCIQCSLSAAPAELLADDPFDSYALGSLIGQEGGHGWDGGWLPGTGNMAVVVDTASAPLVYTTPGGRLVDGNAQAVQVSGTANVVTAARKLGSSLPDSFYASYLLRTTSGTWGGNNTFSIHFSNTAGNTSSLNFGIRAAPDGESMFNHFMVRTATGGPVVGAASGGYVEPDTTYYLVARVSKLDASDSPSGTYDRIEMWINPGEGTLEVWPQGEAMLQLAPGAGLASITHLLVRAAALQSDDLVQFDEVRITTEWPLDLPSAPSIANLTPLSGAMFVNPADGIRFEVSSSEPVAANDIRLVLDGNDVSGSLTISGTPTARQVAYTGLQGGRLYSGEISVANSAGARSRSIQFDTFSESNLQIEAEDFNFGGGQFFDDPVLCNTVGSEARCYFDRVGVEGVDEHKSGPNANIPLDQLYRFGNSFEREERVDTTLSLDVLRGKFLNATPGMQGEIRDFDVTTLSAGDWLNYTRSFGAGDYAVYLRVRSTVAQQVSLSKVTQPTSPNQTTSTLGVFLVPVTGGNYAFVPLTAVDGRPLTVSLSGVETLRLTAIEASQNMQWNFLLLAPAEAPSVPAFIASITPSDGAVNVSPSALIRIELTNAGTDVQSNTIELRLDGADVTAATSISTTAGGVAVEYRPAVLLPGLHNASVRFQDNLGATTETSWSFTVQNVPVLPAGWAAPVGSGSNRGFNVRSAQTLDATGLPVNLTRAEDQLAMPPRVTVDYSGTDTPMLINYKERSEIGDQGYFTGANGFPDRAADQSEAALIVYGLFDFDDASHNNFAVEATFFLELEPGLARLGVNANDSFRLTAGKGGEGQEAFPLVLGEYGGEGGATAGQPQYPCNVIVTKAGVYAFRLVWAEYVGSSSVELHVRDSDGISHLVNHDASPVNAYRARTQEPPAEQTELSIAKNAGGSVTLRWDGGGRLESAESVLGPWSQVVGANNVYQVTPQGTRFYRVAQ
jgi:hypothetical protein